jgi:hypothetical protein
MTTAQEKWRRLRGSRLLADVVEGVKFKDGGTRRNESAAG